MTHPFPWQTTQWQRVIQAHRQGQLPHALLLHGPEGIGKDDFARAVAGSILCEQPDEDGTACGRCKACQLFDSGNHPDHVLLEPEEVGKAIKVDQIRELIQRMSLSPHLGAYRVVVISPAQQMNMAAANSLLKTLEEPQDNTLLLLVCSQLSRLPATIRSRCQRLRFALPGEAQALAWLEQSIDDPNQAGQLLSTANGAPLLARQMAAQDALPLRQQLLADLAAVAMQQKQPLAVAADWQKLGSPLQWVYHWVCDMIRIKCGAARFATNQDLVQQLQSLAQTVDLSRLYQFLDQLNDAMRMRQTSANELLLLEGLLLNWAYLKTNR